VCRCWPWPGHSACTPHLREITRLTSCRRGGMPGSPDARRSRTAPAAGRRLGNGFRREQELRRGSARARLPIAPGGTPESGASNVYGVEDLERFCKRLFHLAIGELAAALDERAHHALASNSTPITEAAQVYLCGRFSSVWVGSEEVLCFETKGPHGREGQRLKAGAVAPPTAPNVRCWLRAGWSKVHHGANE
jgi:hypothetical protein